MPTERPAHPEMLEQHETPSQVEQVEMAEQPAQVEMPAMVENHAGEAAVDVTADGGAEVETSVEVEAAVEAKADAMVEVEDEVQGEVGAEAEDGARAAGRHSAQGRSLQDSQAFDLDAALMAPDQERYGYVDDELPVPRRGKSSVPDFSKTQYIGRKARKNAKHRRRRNVVIAAVVLVALAVGASGYAAWSVSQVVDQVDVVSNASQHLTEDLAAGDFEHAAQDARELSEAAQTMASHTDSPGWIAVSLVPVAGGEVAAVRTLAASVRDVSGDVLVPLTEQLSANAPASLWKQGKIDTAAVTAYMNVQESSMDTLKRCADDLNRIVSMDNEELMNAVVSARVSVNTLCNSFEVVEGLSPAIKSLFGNYDKKTYLVAGLTQTRPRAVGGVPVSLGTITIDDGKITVSSFSRVESVLGLGYSDLPDYLKIPEEDSEYFGESYDSLDDVVTNPLYPNAAEAYAKAYQRATETKLSGAMFLTPTALQSLIGITGDITLSDGTKLTGKNAVQKLQSDLYWDYAYEKKRSLAKAGVQRVGNLMSEALGESLGNLATGLNNEKLNEFVVTLQEDARDRQVLVWLTDSDGQMALVDTGHAGSLSTDLMKPEMGVFTNMIEDGTQLGMYLKVKNTVGAGVVNRDGSVTYEVKTEIRNTLKLSDISKRSKLLTGSKGYIDLDLKLYAPYKGTLEVVEGDGNLKPSNGKHGQFKVSSFDGLSLAPGKRISVSCKVTIPYVAASKLRVSTNPTLGGTLK